MLEREGVEEACHKLVGICASQMDVAAGVTSQTAGNVEAEVVEVGGGERTLVGELACGVYATCAAYKYLGVVFRVEVEENVAFNHTVAEVVGAGESCFLIYGEESFDGTVHEVFVDHNGQGGSHTDAVVGAEGGAVGTEPIAVDNSFDRLCLEVEVLVVALAHHIHMSLHHHSRSAFAACGGRFRHSYVAYGIGADGDAVLSSEVEQELTYFLLLFGWTGQLVDFVENRENQSRLEVFDCHGLYAWFY